MSRPEENGRRSGPDSQRRGPLSPGVPLGRWAGVPIGAHWSTAATLGLFAWLLAADALPSASPGHSRGGYWVVGIATSAVFLATLLAHELAHAVAARHYGMRVRRITLWMLGGVTELDGEAPSPRADAWIAAIGPLTSIGIGAVCGVARWLAGPGGLIGGALLWLAEVSVFLGMFNLLPGAPLDGGRLLRAVLWRRYGDHARASAGAARAGRVLGAAFVALGILEWLAGGVDGLWLALIGWFILSSATVERDSAGIERLRGLTVGQVMRPVVLTVPSWWTVEQLLGELWSRRAMSQVFPVVDFAGDATGVVTLADLRRVQPAARDTVRIQDIVRPATASMVPPDAPISDCLPALARGIIVVTENGRPVGLVTSAEINHAVRLAELGAGGPLPHDQDHPTAA